jgi:hypothetical protein
MPVNSYDVGQGVVCEATFRNLAAALADPTTVTFKFETPAGAETTYVYLTDAQLVRDSLGLFHVNLTASAHGIWKWRWQSTGDPTAAIEGEFRVNRTVF